MAIIMLLAAALRLWNLRQHEFGNIYYAAAVRSMASSWRNFFYGAFDPAGFLAIDRPPVAFWFQVLSVKLFGYSGLALHLPQVVEGLMVVGLVYLITRRVAGERSGLVAALAMALFPASVAVDRSNLADSCLVLVLVMAAWAVLRASENRRLRWLLIGAFLVGIGFSIKMMAAYVTLPAFVLLHWLEARGSPARRGAELVVAATVLLVVYTAQPSCRTSLSGREDSRNGGKGKMLMGVLLFLFCSGFIPAGRWHG